MDKITKGFLDAFSSSYGLDHMDEDTQFEHFANYCALSAETSGMDDFDIQKMHTGSCVQGIDGIAIEVNGSVVENTDDISRLINQNKRLDVKFVIVQAKTTEHFKNGDIGNFLVFVDTFFSDNASNLFETEEMRSFVELKECIYENSKYMKQSNPKLCLYYITLGNWNDCDKSLQVTINSHKEKLELSHLFSTVDFIPCDAQKIQKLYRKSQEKLSATFTFANYITMFSENGDFGYSGVLPFAEFKKIICDDNAEFLKNVFEDNIRDFLGEKNFVNESIEQTISQGNKNAFCMLNNGITIVALSANAVGNTITINDYQIVNGCQTSHILYLNRTLQTIDSLLIPIRIIVTNNEDLKSQITKATNSQTSIKKEQLEALSTYQKTLEEYYKTYTAPNEKLYYERRTGQFRNESIQKMRIVSIRAQIKNMSAMFNEKPHDAAGHYSLLMEDIGTKLFLPDDKPSLYYTSSLALFRFENLIKTKQIDSSYSKGKYHVIMLFKYLFQDVPKYHNSKKVDSFCTKMQTVLNDPKKSLAYFNKIIFYIKSFAVLDLEDRKLFERKETTDLLLSKLEQLK